MRYRVQHSLRPKDPHSSLTEKQVDGLFEVGKTLGIQPCERDPETGHILLGHYTFIPEEESSDVPG